jgi:hypothetical protein
LSLIRWSWWAWRGCRIKGGIEEDRWPQNISTSDHATKYHISRQPISLTKLVIPNPVHSSQSPLPI